MSNFVVGQTITIPQTNSWEAHQAEIIEITDDVLTLLTYIVDHMVASCIRRQ